MINRNNNVFEIAAKKGAEISRQKQFVSPYKIMEEIGLPFIAIERVIYEPHNIRSTD